MDQGRVCKSCGSAFPLDRKYYPSVGGTLSLVCRGCLEKRKKARNKRDRKRRQESLRKVEASGVDYWLSQVRAGGSNIPHSAEVIERVVEYFGGVGGFSAMLVKQYYDAPPGSSTRSRLLETICRLVSKNVDQGGVKKPITLWTDEELERELQTRFQQAVRVIQGEVEDGRQAKKKAPAGITANDPERPATDPVREGGTEIPPERTAGAEGRGTETLQAEPEPGSVPRLPGE